MWINILKDEISMIGVKAKKLPYLEAFNWVVEL